MAYAILMKNGGCLPSVGYWCNCEFVKNFFCGLFIATIKTRASSTNAVFKSKLSSVCGHQQDESVFWWISSEFLIVPQFRNWILFGCFTYAYLSFQNVLNSFNLKLKFKFPVSNNCFLINGTPIQIHATATGRVNNVLI